MQRVVLKISYEIDPELNAMWGGKEQCDFMTTWSFPDELPSLALPVGAPSSGEPLQKTVRLMPDSKLWWYGCEIRPSDETREIYIAAVEAAAKADKTNYDVPAELDEVLDGKALDFGQQPQVSFPSLKIELVPLDEKPFDEVPRPASASLKKPKYTIEMAPADATKPTIRTLMITQLPGTRQGKLTLYWQSADGASAVKNNVQQEQPANTLTYPVGIKVVPGMAYDLWLKVVDPDTDLETILHLNF